MPILTTTCTVTSITDNGDGSSDVSVTWGYSDGTTFGTSYTLTSGDHAAMEEQLRSQVRGPNREEDSITFTWPDPA